MKTYSALQLRRIATVSMAVGNYESAEDIEAFNTQLKSIDDLSEEEFETFLTDAYNKAINKGLVDMSGNLVATSLLPEYYKLIANSGFLFGYGQYREEFDLFLVELNTVKNTNQLLEISEKYSEIILQRVHQDKQATKQSINSFLEFIKFNGEVVYENSKTDGE